MYPRIRALRRENGFNQTVIARMLGMSQTGYSKYETGENDISPALLMKLAYFYDTSVEYLMGISDRRDYAPRNIQQEEACRHYRSMFRYLSQNR